MFAVLTQTTASDALGRVVDMLSRDCEPSALLADLATAEDNVSRARAIGVGRPTAYLVPEAANKAGLLA